MKNIGSMIHIGDLSIVFVLVFLLASCSKPEVPISELRDFVENPDNGLSITHSKGDINISVVYRPKELVFIPRLGDDPQAWEKQLKDIDSLDYFILRFSRGDKEIENTWGGDERRFADLISYLSYGIAEDLSLIVGSDTFEPLDVVYSRTFGTAKATSVMVIFNSNLGKRSGATTLRHQGRFLSTGLSEFSFDTKNIKSIPSLKFPI